MQQLQLVLPPELSAKLDAIDAKLGQPVHSPEFWTVDQVAAHRGCSPETIRRHIKQGKLQVTQTDFGRRIHRNHINP